MDLLAVTVVGVAAGAIGWLLNVLLDRRASRARSHTVSGAGTVSTRRPPAGPKPRPLDAPGRASSGRG